MKRFLIILLIVCILVVATDIVLAKVSFGGWDKWDEEFPPYKIWERYRDDGLGFFREATFKDDKQHFCWVFNLLPKNKKDSMSIMLFSYERPDPETFKEDYKFALAAFPPVKGKMMIRAYYKEEGGILRLLEEWEVTYEDNYSIVTTEVEGKFVKAFREWAEMSSRKVDLDVRLVVFDKGFVILLGGESENKDLLNKIEESLK